MNRIMRRKSSGWSRRQSQPHRQIRRRPAVLLKNRVGIVTGAARGIGLATAQRLAHEGASVVMADVDEKELGRAAGALLEKGYRVLQTKCDVGSRDDVARMVGAAEKEFGEIHLLINNAGIAGPVGPLEQVSDEDWETVMAVDLKSVYLCCRAVLPGMKARRYGRIVN